MGSRFTVTSDQDFDRHDSLVTERLQTWRPGFQPENDEQEWLFAQVVVSSVRIDRLQVEEARLIQYEAQRAELCWEEDRRLAAEIQAASLRSKPGVVVARLRQSRQGCGLLIERWQGLRAVLEGGSSWTE